MVIWLNTLPLRLFFISFVLNLESEHFLLAATRCSLRKVSLETPDFAQTTLPVSEVTRATAAVVDPVDSTTLHQHVEVHCFH